MPTASQVIARGLSVFLEALVLVLPVWRSLLAQWHGVSKDMLLPSPGGLGSIPGDWLVVGLPTKGLLLTSLSLPGDVHG